MTAPSLDMLDDAAVLRALTAATNSFRQRPDVPDSFAIHDAYVVGSVSEGCATETSDLDLLLSMTSRDDDLSEDEFEAICDEFQSHIFWDHSESILKASNLELPATRRNLDVFVFPDGVAQFKLDEYRSHGGYDTVYSLTSSNG